MTQFPTLIDQVATAVLAPAPVAENPHHRAILDVFAEVQDLDRQLASLSGDELPEGVSASEQFDKLTSVLIERMAAGAELNALLSTTCCCAAAYEPDEEPADEPVDDGGPEFDPDLDFDPALEPDFEPDFDPDLEDDFEPDFEDFEAHAPEHDGVFRPSRPKTIVHACLDAFDALAAPEYVTTTDLVAYLRDLPGEAEERRPYADITAVRLGRLLLPFGVRPRKPRAADGSRYTAYRRSDLLAARPNWSC
ncbi:DUF3631 domain-containing protein [Streptomyces silvisoli]|uniref:DUF3631 domain-containing protein n=1 Tax=Streptomyces silvisoli TaxID=3034235 RepID=A0ABT5ZRH5_9ACTN|nr:DUF3631 domain-containing protein [Streptomyces silvisoli]MDF3292429.1 DUF3631 domain-containing protein [Streptomyces silvisoli]